MINYSWFWSVHEYTCFFMPPKFLTWAHWKKAPKKIPVSFSFSRGCNLLYVKHYQRDTVHENELFPQKWFLCIITWSLLRSWSRNTECHNGQLSSSRNWAGMCLSRNLIPWLHVLVPTEHTLNNFPFTHVTWEDGFIQTLHINSTMQNVEESENEKQNSEVSESGYQISNHMIYHMPVLLLCSSRCLLSLGGGQSTECVFCPVTANLVSFRTVGPPSIWLD